MFMPTCPDLYEFDLRRPEFTEFAVPIKLADDQDWFFPKPWVEVRGRSTGSAWAIGSAKTTFGRELDEAVDLIRKAETNHDLVVATLTLGGFLLKRQYDLTDAQIEDLLVFRFADEQLTQESLAMVMAIADVAMGRGEASFRDGSGSD